MPKKKDVAIFIAKMGLSFLGPGGKVAEAGLDKLLTRNDDPDDDADEIAAALADMVFGAMLAAEGLTEKDFVDESVIYDIKAAMVAEFVLYPKLFRRFLKKPIVPPVPPPQ